MIWSIQEVFLTVEQALGLSHRLDDTYTKEGYYRRFAPTLPTSSMTFHEELLQSCPPPSGSMFGKEEDGSDAGLNQAKVLSGLMRTTRPFCLLCLGDMELVYLLAGRKFGTDRCLESGGNGRPRTPITVHSQRIQAGTKNYSIPSDRTFWMDDHAESRLRVAAPLSPDTLSRR